MRPERIELPTSWFVAMHSIQLSYGRMLRGIAPLNYSGIDSFRPNQLRQFTLGKSLRRKSFRPPRKTYRLLISRLRVNNGLGMATQMLIFSQDEVARNGAFGKILRPEVFPDAPLHFPRPSTSLSRPKPVPLSFPALPRESSPGMRISRETGGLGLSPTERPTRNNTQARTN